ncbi:MAG: hypothetical protein ACFWT2_08655 [Thermoanaerobacterium thermosaccharolyticum]
MLYSKTEKIDKLKTIIYNVLYKYSFFKVQNVITCYVLTFMDNSNYYLPNSSLIYYTLAFLNTQPQVIIIKFFGQTLT